MIGIAEFATVVLDCPDSVALGEFYRKLTGWSVEPDADPADPIDWVELESPTGATIACQLVDDYRPPEWPSSDRPQQVHLDFYLDDLDDGEQRVLSIGATKAAHQPGQTFRVFVDPAGHPFCLCLV